MTGWLWYVIMLLPVIGLIQVGSQAHADRYTYLPQIGLYIAVTWGIVDLSRSFPYRREILSIVAPLIIVVLGWRSWIQTSYWHDTERLWNRTLAVTKQNELAHLAMGEFNRGLSQTMYLAVGVMMGAPIGAAISTQLRGSLIVRLLAAALCLVGIRLLIHWF